MKTLLTLPRLASLEKGPLLVPLTSNAFAGDSGIRSSRACRITHGPHDFYFDNLVGRSVASVRRSLATVFSISTNAEAFVGVSAVDQDYRCATNVILPVFWSLFGKGIRPSDNNR
jgi:hypothetical protein